MNDVKSVPFLDLLASQWWSLHGQFVHCEKFLSEFDTSLTPLCQSLESYLDAGFYRIALLEMEPGERGGKEEHESIDKSALDRQLTEKGVIRNKRDLNFKTSHFFPLDKPQFPDDTEGGALKVFTVEEGASILIDLTAKGNPAKIDYKWTSPDRDNIPSQSEALPESRLVANGGTLNISSAKRMDAGKYKVRGSNDEGKTTFKFKLDVLYEPR